MYTMLKFLMIAVGVFVYGGEILQSGGISLSLFAVGIVVNKYTNLNRTNQLYVDTNLLIRAIPNNILGQFGQVRPIPKNSSDTINFRRYNKFAPAITPLVESVTPDGKSMTYLDVFATLSQYGDFVSISDVAEDMTQDPVANEAIDILAEQAPETYDILRAGVLQAGTNVQYAGGGVLRTSVNSIITVAMLRTASRILGKQEAKHITGVIKAGLNISTTPIRPAYIVCCHVDVQPDLEGLTGWTPVAEYSAQMGIINGEIGSILNFRFVIDNNIVPFEDAGDTKGSTLSTSGVKSDVYPLLIFGKNAYGLVGLGGKGSVQTFVSKRRAQDGDPLAQRGTMGWKGYMTTVILYDPFMLRMEVAANG